MPVPYLFFDGTCAEAMTEYARILNGHDLNIMYWEQAPEGVVPETAQKKVMHAGVTLETGRLFASDYPEGIESEVGRSPSLCVTPKTLERSQEIFDALSQGAKVQFPLGPNFFSPGYADLIDRFGTHWMIVTDLEQA